MYVTNISLRVQIWLDDRISPSPRYPDVWSMSQLCYCTTVDPPFHSHDPWAPRVQRQRQDQRRRSQKKPRVGGLKCHDFPLILLIRFLDHFRFYTFMMFLSVRRFHVGLQVSLIAGPSGGPNLQAHHLHIHIIIWNFVLTFNFADVTCHQVVQSRSPVVPYMCLCSVPLLADHARNSQSPFSQPCQAATLEELKHEIERLRTHCWFLEKWNMRKSVSGNYCVVLHQLIVLMQYCKNKPVDGSKCISS